MEYDRIQFEPYKDKIISAEDAANLIQDHDVIGSSGFTKAGDSKAVLPALAKRALDTPISVTLITGASLGHTTDADLSQNKVLYKRMPFQADATLRKAINNHEVLYIDQHLSETAELLHNQHLPKLNLAILEAAGIDQNGNLIPTTSIGNSATFAALATHIIIEINRTVPLAIGGIHDVFVPKEYPHKEVIGITAVQTRIGNDYITIDPKKVIGIVFTETPDSPAQLTAPDIKTTAIAGYLMDFFQQEVASGRLTKSLLPLQAGIGKVANAVLSGFVNSPFENLTMYSEVLQDSTFELLDSGKMSFASASSITVSEGCYKNFLENLPKYNDKLLLRPQNISNAAEVIRRLGIIAINTAIEFDIYGNVNSTHISGTKMMNGIGGSGDFARNAYLSIFVTQSASKENNAISHVLPMVSHVDHTEHDVDILVTDQGLADLRGLAPRERAEAIIANCVHPDYRNALEDYFHRASAQCGHTPHILEEAFSWHTRFSTTGSMQESCLVE